MRTPFVREVPPSTNHNFARVGLDVGPKEPLLMGGAKPSGPGHINGDGLSVSFVFMFLLY
jgi:hypothetical protein